MGRTQKNNNKQHLAFLYASNMVHDRSCAIHSTCIFISKHMGLESCLVPPNRFFSLHKSILSRSDAQYNFLMCHEFVINPAFNEHEYLRHWHTNNSVGIRIEILSNLSLCLNNASEILGTVRECHQLIR